MNELAKLCADYQLGSLRQGLTPLSGGRLHAVSAFETEQGRFVLKKLNPSLLVGSKALLNFRHSENIARAFVSKGLPVVAANCHADDNVLYPLGEDWVMVYSYCPGSAVPLPQLLLTQIGHIARVLGQLHQADLRTLPAPVTLSYELHSMPPRELTANDVVSHRDLDPKNVLWHQGKPFLIDWELAGWVDRTCDVISTALYWSFTLDYQIEYQRLRHFLTQYPLSLDANLIDTAFYRVVDNCLSWIDFNVRHKLVSAASEIKITLAAIRKLLTHHKEIIRVITEAIADGTPKKSQARRSLPA